MLKKNMQIIIFNIIIIIAILAVFNQPTLRINLYKYIMCSSDMVDAYNFKDLLSILTTILSIFIGFIATIATVLISMCDKRIMVLINKFNKSNLVIKSIKKSLKFGIIALIGISIIYVNFDFNILIIRLIIIWISLNSLFIFVSEGKFLVFLVRRLMEDTLLNDNNK